MDDTAFASHPTCVAPCSQLLQHLSYIFKKSNTVPQHHATMPPRKRALSPGGGPEQPPTGKRQKGNVEATNDTGEPLPKPKNLTGLAHGPLPCRSSRHDLEDDRYSIIQESVRLIPGVTSNDPKAPNMVVVPSNQSRSIFATPISPSKNCSTRLAEATGFSSPCSASAENYNKPIDITYNPMP